MSIAIALTTWCAISCTLGLILGPMLASRLQPGDSIPVMGVMHG